MNLTSDKTHNGSATLTLTKDAVANIFCLGKSEVNEYMDDYQTLFADVDTKYANLSVSSTDDGIPIN